MFLKRPAVWISIVSALLVVAFVVWDTRMVSPGAISAAHAQDQNLRADDCAACHGEMGASMQKSCAACHAEVERGIAGRTGFHGRMIADASRCGTCHPEHHGAEFQLVSAQSFALAGVADRGAYEHEKLDFALAGRHTELTCRQCHEHADDNVLAKGCQRFLGKSQKCSSCHDDPHQGRLADCKSCHGEDKPFETVAAFVHPSSFVITGMHQKAGCLDCHRKGTDHAVEASSVIGPQGVSTRPTRTCAECHPSPHAENFVAEVASRLAVKSGATCESCHAPTHDSFRGDRVALDRIQHAASGFALDAPHDKASCAQCHAPSKVLTPAPEGADAATAFRALHPGRSANECSACHVDPHAGQFANGAFAQGGCLACHDRHAFVPSTFDASKHARTSFPLTGKHASTECSLCHAKTAGTAVRVFHGTESACSSCHADAHKGFFERPGVPAAFGGEVGCARCHRTDSFDATRSEPFDHARWTGYALLGQHADAECASCHPRRDAPDAAGRTFGFVGERFEGPVQACSTCHVDVHAGAFDKPNLPTTVDTRSDCARCHVVESFGSTVPPFDHGTWTGFALLGAHAKCDCAGCHTESGGPDGGERRLGRVPKRFETSAEDCSACHVNVHGDAFDRNGVPAIVDGRKGCERCHTTETFGGQVRERFDHVRWTGFALEGAHAKSACEACHVPVARTAESGRRLGQALGTQCASCHDDSHAGQFAGSGGTDCRQCHSVDSTFQKTSFDHQRDSRFHLDATHAKVTCGACHVRTPLETGGSAVRYKPLGTVCGDCHDPRQRKED